MLTNGTTLSDPHAVRPSQGWGGMGIEPPRAASDQPKTIPHPLVIRTQNLALFGLIYPGNRPKAPCKGT